jgi:Family of unknown function (DUF5694)
MYKQYTKVAAFFVYLFLSVQTFAQENSAKKIVGEQNAIQTKTPIALLGVYHFNNPGQDQFNVKSDNVLTEKRQKELDNLVKELARFKPTHVALEYDRNTGNGDELYQKYLKGEYTLGPDEREQIGFRLAHLLGHKHIFPVDERRIELDFNPGELASEFSSLLEQLSKTGNKIIGDINTWVTHKSIGAVLSQLNTPELDRLNIDLYYRFLLPIGKGNQQPGPDAVARWYQRNLYILHHIKEFINADKSEKRVMVVFGQGHTSMLKQFLQYSSEFELADIQQFLPKD